MKSLKTDILPPEDEYWKEVVKEVQKIPQKEEPPSKPLVINDIAPHVNYQKAYHGAPLSPLTVGSTDNIDRRTAERFKRGEFPIQRRLDLHGMTEKDAYEAVNNFIQNAYIQKLRCVLIITGKGLHKEDENWFTQRGILKEQVPQWLNTLSLRPLILSFSYALPADGGEGALYVLLRAHKNNDNKIG